MIAFDRRRLNILIKKPKLGKNQQRAGLILTTLSLRTAGTLAKQRKQSTRSMWLKKVKQCSWMVYLMRLTLMMIIAAATAILDIWKIVEGDSQMVKSGCKLVIAPKTPSCTLSI